MSRMFLSGYGWIRILFVAVGFLLSALVTAQQADPSDALDDAVRLAESAYSTGDYASAVQFFEEAVALAQSDRLYSVLPELYYNLASAYFEANDLGFALVNALRAQHEMPRDAELARMLALIRALRVDVMGDETALIDVAAAATRGVLGVEELALITFVLWSAAFALLMFRLLRPDIFRRLALIAAVIAVAAGVSVVLLFSRQYVDVYRPAAVVTAFTSQARSGPGEVYIPLFTLYNAAEGRVLDEQAGYARLLLPDGRQGWIPIEDLTLAGL